MDEYNKIQLYRHCDGYPSSVLPALMEVFKYAWELPRFEATDFSAAIVRAWKDEGGGNVYIDGEAKRGKVKNPEDYFYIKNTGWKSLHGDIEWLYVISQNDREPLYQGGQRAQGGAIKVEITDGTRKDTIFIGEKDVTPERIEARTEQLKKHGLRLEGGTP